MKWCFPYEHFLDVRVPWNANPTHSSLKGQSVTIFSHLRHSLFFLHRFLFSITKCFNDDRQSNLLTKFEYHYRLFQCDLVVLKNTTFNNSYTSEVSWSSCGVRWNPERVLKFLKDWKPLFCPSTGHSFREAQVELLFYRPTAHLALPNVWLPAMANLECKHFCQLSWVATNYDFTQQVAIS